MENDKIIRMITEKCDVYYDDALPVSYTHLRAHETL